jgi:hypothetical protein
MRAWLRNAWRCVNQSVALVESIHSNHDVQKERESLLCQWKRSDPTKGPFWAPLFVRVTLLHVVSGKCMRKAARGMRVRERKVLNGVVSIPFPFDESRCIAAAVEERRRRRVEL